MSQNFINYDLHKTCRACLKFLKEDPKTENHDIVELYKKITEIKINAKTNMPFNFCDLCRNEIINYDAFREKCLSNEKLLMQYIQNGESDNVIESIASSEDMDLVENLIFQCSNSQDSQQAQTCGNNNSFSNQSLQCSYCNKFIKNQSLLRHHIKKNHKEAKKNLMLDCETESNSSLANGDGENSSNSLKEDAPKGGKRGHNCFLCKTNFCSFSKLLLHMESHSAEGPVQCEKCPKQLEDYKALTKHMKNHSEKPFLCYNCGKTFQRSSDYSVHMRMHTGERPYECTTCHKKFKTSYMCIIHSRIHTGEKPSQCTVCKKKFVSSSHLSVHMRSHNKSRPYSCKECGRAFSQEKDLEIHSTLHSGQTLFQCDSCGRGFNRKNNLLKHMKLHEGIKTHVCQTCSFAFPTSTQLKTHLRTHTGDRPYLCDQCPAKFASSSGVSRHKKTHKKQNSDPNSKTSLFLLTKPDSNDLMEDNNTEEISDTNLAILDFPDEVSKTNYDPKNNVYVQDITYTLFNNI